MRAFLGLGSNIGDRFYFLDKAINALSKNSVIMKNTSIIYESKPMYYHEQDNFYNQVVEVNVQNTPMELLKIIKKIEVNLGRDLSAKKYSQRVIDIDILSINNIIIEDRILTLPHLKLHERNFVLKPWNEISPNYIIPKYELTVKALFLKLNCSDNIKAVCEAEEVI